MFLDIIPSPLLKFGIFILVIILLIGGFLYCVQDKLLYIPVIPPLEKGMERNPYSYRNPSERNMPYSEVEINTTDNLIIRGWKILQQNSMNCPTFVFFHENAGNIGTRLEYIEKAYKKLDANFQIVGYRGYSNSDGFPSEKGLMDDGHAIMDYIFNQKDIDQNQIYVHGRSLGGAVAIYTLTSRRYRIAGVILENTFTSISAMVDKIFPAVAFLKTFVLRNWWPSLKRVQQFPQHNTLFIRAENDEIVPPEHMEELYNLCSSKNKQWYSIRGANHNASYMVNPDQYFHTIKEWMGTCQKNMREEPLDSDLR